MIAYGCSSLCLLYHVLVVAFEKLDIIFLWILKNISKKLEQLSVSMLDQPQISRNVGKSWKSQWYRNNWHNLKGSSAVDNVRLLSCYL